MGIILGLSLSVLVSTYSYAQGEEEKRADGSAQPKGRLTPWDQEYYLPSQESEQRQETDQHLNLPPNLPEDYLIGSGDVLEVAAWRNEALSKEVVVRPDGRISLPLMGEIQAAGLTPLQLRDKIIAELKEFGETPEATIIVRQINSYAVYVVGEVNRPGRFQLNGRTTIVQAIAMAGGFTSFASPNDIILLRKIEGEDEERRATIRYGDIVSGKQRNIWLQPEDTLIIP
jgi:polysaccharide export outer membrane protein